MTAPNPRYLTKSRFKLAVECPTKLYYAGKPDIYADQSREDEFLQSLAEGGFQVGELAKCMFPGGREITGRTHQQQIDETREWLEAEDVTLFEAAIHHDGLFARVDVLRKAGTEVELIEVKAKSFDSTDAFAFRGKRGGFKSEMLPYLQDVAFQRHVLSLAFPQLRVRGFLMLVDKNSVCSVDGLNQRFKIHRHGGRPSVVTSPGTDTASIGAPVLTCVNVDEYIDEILRQPLAAPGALASLPELARDWAEHYRADERIPPMIGAQCASCQFYVEQPDVALRSGIRECWQLAAEWDQEDPKADSVLALWNFRSKQALIERGVLNLNAVTKGDLNYREASVGLSISQRQWMQVSGAWPGGREFYLDTALMANEMERWTFPLHFIDFETSRVALPFFAGQQPYANVAFQFSHHTVDADGKVAHRSQFLSTEPGRKPNYDFVRQLQSALSGDGTVFMWSHHENTTLRALLDELDQDPEPPDDAEGLKAFIRELTTLNGDNGVVQRGSRAMVDLCDLAQRAFFHPATKGSSSIKKVLQAVLGSSEDLKRRYAQPIYGAKDGIPSLNFTDWVWWRESDGKVTDPYKLLPPVFGDAALDARVGSAFAEALHIAEGGAATTAYARLQFEDIPTTERDRIKAALLRYCELDTLAMVMVYEAWRGWLT